MAIPLGTQPPAPRPRVRHQARDALRLMAFSASCSAGLVAVLALLTHLGRIG